MTSSTGVPRRANHAPLDLAVIRSKCTEEGECWNWRGAMHCGMPTVRHAGQAVSVRRYIAQHIQGRKVVGKMASTRCHNPACCAPDHIELVGSRKLQRRVAVLNPHQKRTSRNQKLSAKQRARSPLTADAVARIRASDQPGRQLAKQFKVTLQTIQRIRNHVTWRDYHSPFIGLQQTRMPP